VEGESADPYGKCGLRKRGREESTDLTFVTRGEMCII